MLCLLLCGAMLLLSGCRAKTDSPDVSETPALLHASVTPAPTLTNDPAIVYTNVLTDKKIISLVLEGFTDEGTMQSVVYAIKEVRIPGIFFVSGIVANEHPLTLKAIAKEGFPIGNYGLNASKHMDKNDVFTNIHQFQRGQELIEAAIGSKPKFFRCNGSVYTREVLQAAAYVGLEEGVEPNIYLNHTSFVTYDDALRFVQRITPGSIISIKLGQVLDRDEYEGTTYTMEYRAVDPPPMLGDKMLEIIAQTYKNIVNVVDWLLKALEEEGYIVVSPEALQAERITMFDSPKTLDADTIALLNADNYALPRTDTLLTNVSPAPTGIAVPQGTPAPDATVNTSLGEGIVFVGDSITVGLQNFVNWQRGTDPGYLGTAQFLTSSDFSMGMSQMNISASSVQPKVDGIRLMVDAALQKLGARIVLLMPGQVDVRGYTEEKFIDNLKLMIYQIRKSNPGIRIYLQSIPPGVADRYTTPDNVQLFKYNLAMYQFCLEYGIPYLDVAYAFRDAQGNLADTLCMDTDTYGIHLNDSGCEKWIDFLRGYMPF